MDWILWVVLFLMILIGSSLNRAVKELQKIPALRDEKLVVGLETYARTLQHPLTRSIENLRSVAWMAVVLLAVRNMWFIF